jgi:hypothetical protein
MKRLGFRAPKRLTRVCLNKLMTKKVTENGIYANNVREFGTKSRPRYRKKKVSLPRSITSEEPLELESPKLPQYVIRRQRKVFDKLAESLGIVMQEDWYKLVASDIIENGGDFINYQYNGSPFLALKTIYPEYDWNIFLFHHISRNAYKSRKTHRELLNWVADRLGIETQDDWYSVTAEQVKSTGAHALINEYYAGSLLRTLRHVFPEFEWDPLLLQFVPHNYWKDKGNQRQFMDWIADSQGVTSQEDWYQLTGDLIQSLGGCRMLNLYNNSLYSALVSVYPEWQWHPWMFQAPPKYYWEVDGNQQKWVDWFTDKLNLHEHNSWNLVTRNDIKRLGGGILTYYGNSMKRMLESLCPNLTIESKISEGQSHVGNVLKSILKTHIFINYKLQCEDREPIELDIYVPELELAFEYNGSVHYDPHYFMGGSTDRGGRDHMKQLLCKERGITLISVPYWWNNSVDSLISSIKHVRPDITIYSSHYLPGNSEKNWTDSSRKKIHSLNSGSVGGFVK